MANFHEITKEKIGDVDYGIQNLHQRYAGVW